MNASTFAALAVGTDLGIVTTAGTRTVRVTGIAGRYVYTTSGKVRPGAVVGGVVREVDGAFYFQPTMQQKNLPILNAYVLP